MKHRFAMALLGTMGACIQANVAVATEHTSKTIEVIQTAISSCYFFRLTGVDQSDPVTPNSPWFAILTTQANAREMYAVLLTARTAGTPLGRVLTNGQTVCGHAQVTHIDY